ncbi:MAG: YdeI/OmpD-associated family protein [Parvularculaceae bacterium]|nr:YdeI/OmpD-associated family protein [Parvularculaceae bacterium]
MRKIKTASEFYSAAPMWKAELASLRKILKSSELKEEVKWGGPCYTLDGENVVGVGAFKSYFGLWFFQGALLKDAGKKLVNAQEGRTKSLRQWRMSSSGDIEPALIASYVTEAAALARAGEKIAKAPARKLVMPAELSAALSKDKKAGAAFAALTPGRQREYADFVSAAKQSATKEKRIAKILPMIREGSGLNDKYRTCQP